MENKENIQKEAKLVFNMGVCRKLLQAGCVAIDCKPDKSNSDKTILVFKNDEHFQKEFERINKEIQESKKEAAVV